MDRKKNFKSLLNVNDIYCKKKIKRVDFKTTT